MRLILPLMLCVVYTAARNSYLITVPKTIVRGIDFNVGVHILNASTPVNVKVNLLEKYTNRSRTYRNNLNGDRSKFFVGSPGSLKLKMPRNTVTTPNSNYYVRIRCTGGLQVDTEKYVRLHPRQIAIMVQTDKAMYKASQKVSFRVVMVFPDLKPYKGMVDIELKDARGNRMMQWFNEKDATGVITKDFQLSDQPVTGDWTITVTAINLDRYQETKTFTVQEYELPKFEVKVELSPFGLHSETELHGKIKAHYTFGKPVEGMVDIRAFKGATTNSCGKEEKSVQQVTPINGEAEFTFSTADIKKITSYWSNLRTVSIIARVTEEATGKTLNGTGKITYYDQRHKLKFLSTSSDIFKPGLPYSAFIKVTTQDDVPVVNSSNRIMVYTCVDFTRHKENQNRYACPEFQGTYDLPVQSLLPSEDGVAKIAIDEVPKNTTKIRIKAWYGNIFVEKTVNAAESRSKNYIQITTTANGRNKIDENINFEIRSTEPLNDVFYTIRSRGSLGKPMKHNMENSKYSSFSIPVTPDMSPSAYIMAYYIRNNSEVVADGLTFNTDKLFQNKVSLSFDQESTKPQMPSTLTVSAQPRSTVFVLAVDQSVLLLKSGNDITTEKVETSMKQFDMSSSTSIPRHWYEGKQSSARGVMQIFEEANMHYVTDITMSTIRHYNSRSRYSHPGMPGRPAPTHMVASDIMFEEMDVSYSVQAGGSNKAFAAVDSPTVSVRKLFPETWLWTNGTVGSDGTVSFSETTPGTITSWVASAFGVHPKTGLGVAETPSKLLVERTFFVSLNLPQSVKYGEVVTIQAIVFNYLDNDMFTEVELKSTDDFKSVVIDSNGEEEMSDYTAPRNIMVESNKPTSVYFPIKPMKHGYIDIEVTAKTPVAGDAVLRNLKVTPQGIRREKNKNVLVKTGNSGDPVKQTISLAAPVNAVPETVKIRLKATGDIMGLSLENFENLIRLPTGCGEQNLLKFAPIVYIADYLSSIQQFEGVAKTRILKSLELGYQKQLSYQRYDRSFSPFGDSDDAGSVWLTSFVLRSFKQASKYIYIDENIIQDGVIWILDRQRDDGAFTEVGTIIDKRLQSDPMTLTSYVLLSLMEVEPDLWQKTDPQEPPQFNRIRLTNATQKAKSYLEAGNHLIADAFSQAIATYVMYKSGSGLGPTAFSRIRYKMKTVGDMRYFEVDPDKKGSSRMSSHDVIATSYVLLNYLIRQNGVEDGYDVMKAILSQRNGRGGFSSSQDTIVALEALSRFAAASRPEDLNMEIRVTRSIEEQVLFDINNDNAMILQLGKMSGPVKELTVTATGSGVAYLDINVEYYMTEADVNDNFDISTVLLDDNLNSFTLMTCCKVLDNNPTGMTTATIQVPPGFSPDLSSINVAGVRRVEQSGNDVNVYFNEIGKTSTCLRLQASRNSMVSGTKDCFIQLTDYYQPDKTSTVSYVPRTLQKATVCDVCPKCC